MQDYQSICTAVCGIATEVGAFIYNERLKITDDIVETKGSHDFVTYVDKASQDKIIAALLPLIPDAGFIAEEKNEYTRSEEYNWIIDPLDGTTNFIHGVPLYSVSIGLTYKDKLVLGVVYEINSKEMFYAWEGSPAYLNGKEIHVSKKTDLDTSLLVTGFPYYDYKYLKPYMEMLAYTMQHSAGIRRLGSAALDLAYVACGRFEVFYEYCLQPWDVAAGAFIVQQAGGKVCDFSGGNDFLFGREIVASNGQMHDEFMDVVNKYFKL